MSHICRILPYLRGSRTFDPCDGLIIASISDGEYPHLKVDLDLSTSPNGGLQVILAIITLTGLLYNCFRTRAEKVANLKRCPLGINLTGRSLVTPGRLELPFTA